MPILDAAQGLLTLMTAWRHDLHQHPETAYQEHRTSAFVADKLADFGYEVHRGLAGTGVVASLRHGNSARSIGLRADMDALYLDELNEFEHRSVLPGVMHACGHDGHTAMLLGAAQLLANRRQFDGTVHLIFQPAEENEAGARKMIEDGLFEIFPMQAVYGLHNIPGLPAGDIHMRVGAQMASADFFSITLTGEGGHAAFPHTVRDPVPAAAEIITALQSIVSRRIDPQEAAVLSVTQMRAGETSNVIAESAMLAGTVRTFSYEVQALIKQTMQTMVSAIAQAHGLQSELSYDERYPPTINHADQTEHARQAALVTVGEARTDCNTPALMAAEDFAWMLKEQPGCYVFLGNGTGSSGGCMVHNPRYDFNDNILPTGASYWVHLVEQQLSLKGE